MKALIVGAGGQLGRALLETQPEGCTAAALTSADLDITDASAVAAMVARHRPDTIFNAAAYTAVDRAESEPERAEAVNALAVGHLAAAARAEGARLVHVSTDFVFDGTAGRPWRPDDRPQPLGVYGATKLAGEAAAGNDAIIVRTAWVYAVTGGNFVHTMLRLMRERDEVRVVADQIGTPTFAPGLASALWGLAARGAPGLYHWTDNGAASWYDFAVAIQEEALARGLLTRAVPIHAIATEDYPTPAQRPSYSVLDKRTTFAAVGKAAPHWRAALRQMLDGVAATTANRS